MITPLWRQAVPAGMAAGAGIEEFSGTVLQGSTLAN